MTRWWRLAVSGERWWRRLELVASGGGGLAWAGDDWWWRFALVVR